MTFLGGEEQLFGGCSTVLEIQVQACRNEFGPMPLVQTSKTHPDFIHIFLLLGVNFTVTAILGMWVSQCIATTLFYKSQKLPSPLYLYSGPVG